VISLKLKADSLLFSLSLSLSQTLGVGHWRKKTKTKTLQHAILYKLRRYVFTCCTYIFIDSFGWWRGLLLVPDWQFLVEDVQFGFKPPSPNIHCKGDFITTETQYYEKKYLSFSLFLFDLYVILGIVITMHVHSRSEHDSCTCCTKK